MDGNHEQYTSYWGHLWKQYKRHRLGLIGLCVVFAFCLVGIYAPFLASSKPIFVVYDGQPYFPLFRYLFYTEFFTKRLDIFFNLLIFTFPLFLLCLFTLRHKRKWLALAWIALCALQIILFLYLIYRKPHDPASDPKLTQERQLALKNDRRPDWAFDLRFMNPYAKLNMILRFQQREEQHKRIEAYLQSHSNNSGAPLSIEPPPTLWQIDLNRENEQIERAQKIILSLEQKGDRGSEEYLDAQAKVQFLQDRRQWLEEQTHKLQYLIMPLVRPFHWEDDAGGEQSLNQHIPWWELTRINRKDLVAALIFGVRISLVVGLLAVWIALMIGIPIGAYAGYYGGTFDILVSRMLEIWESMPTFFMLLMIVAITQSKSIFLVIAVIGLFGWTGFSRYIRGEFFKQRNLPYVEAGHALGYSESHLMFIHIMPNAIPPLLTLLPFAIMGAITSEAGLSFLGLGEEGSCSWGVLMDEGRTAFPGESYLLWPPAILLTILLIAIALVGDALRDALDPKLE